MRERSYAELASVGGGDSPTSRWSPAGGGGHGEGGRHVGLLGVRGGRGRGGAWGRGMNGARDNVSMGGGHIPTSWWSPKEGGGSWAW